MKRALIILGTLVLGACTSIGTNGDPLPQITFNHIKPYPLYVASYEIIGLSEANSLTIPDGFVSDPSQIVYDYLNSRFEAAGNQGKFLAQIRSVDITHNQVSSDSSINAFVGLDKKDHYRVTVVVNLSTRGVHDVDWQRQNLTVYRDIYVSEYVSMVDREKLEMQAMDHMIDDLDIALRKILREQFGIL
ncbi:MAG: hypothetical protein KAJ40_07325 [Alphaproteobacteria bacterium]|nr:hypothetical protein [Alphaproteobacteria bacterium]